MKRAEKPIENRDILVHGIYDNVRVRASTIKFQKLYNEQNL
jgi:hypothetical protein